MHRLGREAAVRHGGSGVRRGSGSAWEVFPFHECPEPDPEQDLFPADLPASTTIEAGAIGGSFSVTSTGEAVYTMPLVVPPGRAGMQPALAISYDSTAGEGPLGVGFSISGLSSIARCPRNLAQDGEIQPVRDEQLEAFCLDGKRLVNYGLVNVYRTFPDTFQQIVADYAIGDGWDFTKGPRSFQVFTKSGGS
jgi:hypothetical protein